MSSRKAFEPGHLRAVGLMSTALRRPPTAPSAARTWADRHRPARAQGGKARDIHCGKSGSLSLPSPNFVLSVARALKEVGALTYQGKRIERDLYHVGSLPIARDVLHVAYTCSCRQWMFFSG